MTTTLTGQDGPGGGAPLMRMSARKGEKCLCGKRAKATIVSSAGRELLPCCAKCGLICLEFNKRRENDECAHVNSVPEELARWFTTDSGTSSMVIASVLVPSLRTSCLLRLDGQFSTPRDPDDFGRCRRLLKLIPNGVGRLVEVALAHPKWAPMVAIWAELDALYEEEAPTGMAPKMYARMKEVRDG